MDQVFIAGEEAIAVSPEGQRAAMPLPEFFDRVRPPVMDTGALTLAPGVRAVLSDGCSCLLVFEIEPVVRRVKWSATSGRAAYNRLAMPYVVILAVYSRDQSPGPFLSLAKHNEVYFRREPIRDIRTDTLLFPPLLNVSRFAIPISTRPGEPVVVPRTDVFKTSDRTIALVQQPGQPFLTRDVQVEPGPAPDQVTIVGGLEPGDILTISAPRMPLSWICTQFMPRVGFDYEKDDSKRMNIALAELTRHLFDSGFTKSSEDNLGHNNEAGSWHTFSTVARVDKRVSTPALWQRATDQDPLFVINDVPFLEVGMTVEQVARRQLANASNRSNHRARRTSDDYARLIFNRQTPAQPAPPSQPSPAQPAQAKQELP